MSILLDGDRVLLYGNTALGKYTEKAHSFSLLRNSQGHLHVTWDKDTVTML